MNQQKRDIINHILNYIAPGTRLREGIDNVLRAGTGGLIVIGFDEKVKGLVEGGFSIHCPFTPANLYELAKMDGAIILSEDVKQILYANTQLVPESGIPSSETGIRHRTAERVAKQTGKLIISVSQRRSVVTLYKGNIRYSLRDIGVILTKANQAMQTLEKYRLSMDKGLVNLGALEFEELVTFQEICQIIHRISMVLKIRDEIAHYVYELGTEGRLIDMQLKELVANVEEEALLLVKDYARSIEIDPKPILDELRNLNSNDLLNESVVARIFGYQPNDNLTENIIFPRGYRVLSRIPRLPHSIMDNLISHFSSLDQIMKATIKELDEVEGIGTKRAQNVKEGLERIQRQLFVERVV
ncbi:DNA integrity scanning protein DisA [Pullulanibacillus camelliae]|uniref:diadenylate cyclase n=1 Tax=Pullulanibacillus camelliae TaxID=1707096 RepID=A0A8J2YNF0_9BACL|nr:DNA integrity scanning diadenylate cyclase DisA [Pullulanibacillus camelliae]GGE56760.1 DNA integrity scanning protein DisA [Pullulanibacillus camelliae]